MDSFQKQKIKYINFCGINDLNAPICDLRTLGLMASENLDCTTDAYIREGVAVSNPCLMQDNLGKLDLYYPYQIINAMVNQRQKLGELETLETNIFTTLEFLQNIIIPETSPILFKYKVREIYNPRGQHVEPGKSNQLPEIFSFEIGLFNIFQFSQNYGIVLRQREDTAIFKNKPGVGFGTGLDCADRVHKLAIRFVEERLKLDTSDYDLKDIMDVFVNHYYEVLKASESIKFKNKSTFFG